MINFFRDLKVKFVGLFIFLGKILNKFSDNVGVE